jgi:hypothetical protein
MKEPVPLGRFQPQVGLMGLHVSDRLEADDRSHDGCDQHHDQGEIVSIQADGGFLGLQAGKIKIRQ